jgi:hypothetical protein
LIKFYNELRIRRSMNLNSVSRGIRDEQYDRSASLSLSRHRGCVKIFLSSYSALRRGSTLWSISRNNDDLWAHSKSHSSSICWWF